MFIGLITTGVLLAVEFSTYGGAASLPAAVAIGVLVVVCVYVAAFAWSWGERGGGAAAAAGGSGPALAPATCRSPLSWPPPPRCAR